MIQRQPRHYNQADEWNLDDYNIPQDSDNSDDSSVSSSSDSSCSSDEYDDYNDMYNKYERSPFLQELKKRSHMLNSIPSSIRNILSCTFDRRNAVSLILIATMMVVALQLAETGYILTSDPKSVVASGFASQFEYDNPIFTPGSEYQLRQIEEFEGTPMFEYGEAHTKSKFTKLARPAMGASRFEFGEFSGIAITPDQYLMADRKQADLNRNFWSWVRATTPSDYYEFKVQSDKSLGGGENGEVEDGIISYTEGGLPIPSMSGYKDVWEPFDETDSPIFFHIPKAGGTTLKNVIGTCHRLTMATETGVMNGHGQDTEIGVVRPYANPAEGKEGTPFINVDTTTTDGIIRAKALGLAESGLAECIVSPLLYDAETIFSPQARGRIFTIFRHPLDRAVSMFFYIQVADWEASYNPLLATMSIEDYATSTYVENNWMVRRLADVDKTVKLTEDHLHVGMDIVRRKFLVGLLSKKEESLDRFEKFFGWRYKVKPDNQEICRKSLLEQGANSNIHDELPEEGSAAHNALLFHNRWDLLLYEYIEGLFLQQAAFVNHVPDDFRLIDATCSKCIPPTFPEF